MRSQAVARLRIVTTAGKVETLEKKIDKFKDVIKGLEKKAKELDKKKSSGMKPGDPVPRALAENKRLLKQAEHELKTLKDA